MFTRISASQCSWTESKFMQRLLFNVSQPSGNEFKSMQNHKGNLISNSRISIAIITNCYRGSKIRMKISRRVPGGWTGNATLKTISFTSVVVRNTLTKPYANIQNLEHKLLLSLKLYHSRLRRTSSLEGKCDLTSPSMFFKRHLVFLHFYMETFIQPISGMSLFVCFFRIVSRRHDIYDRAFKILTLKSHCALKRHKVRRVT